jgi:hypothetical protein
MTRPAGRVMVVMRRYNRKGAFRWVGSTFRPVPAGCGRCGGRRPDRPAELHGSTARDPLEGHLQQWGGVVGRSSNRSGLADRLVLAILRRGVVSATIVRCSCPAPTLPCGVGVDGSVCQ